MLLYVSSLFKSQCMKSAEIWTRGAWTNSELVDVCCLRGSNSVNTSSSRSYIHIYICWSQGRKKHRRCWTKGWKVVRQLSTSEKAMTTGSIQIQKKKKSLSIDRIEKEQAQKNKTTSNRKDVMVATTTRGLGLANVFYSQLTPCLNSLNLWTVNKVWMMRFGMNNHLASLCIESYSGFTNHYITIGA